MRPLVFYFTYFAGLVQSKYACLNCKHILLNSLSIIFDVVEYTFDTSIAQKLIYAVISRYQKHGLSFILSESYDLYVDNGATVSQVLNIALVLIEECQFTILIKELGVEHSTVLGCEYQIESVGLVRFQ